MAWYSISRSDKATDRAKGRHRQHVGTGHLTLRASTPNLIRQFRQSQLYRNLTDGMI